MRVVMSSQLAFTHKHTHAPAYTHILSGYDILNSLIITWFGLFCDSPASIFPSLIIAHPFSFFTFHHFLQKLKCTLPCTFSISSTCTTFTTRIWMTLTFLLVVHVLLLLLLIVHVQLLPQERGTKGTPKDTLIFLQTDGVVSRARESTARQARTLLIRLLPVYGMWCLLFKA